MKKINLLLFLIIGMVCCSNVYAETCVAIGQIINCADVDVDCKVSDCPDCNCPKLDFGTLDCPTSTCDVTCPEVNLNTTCPECPSIEIPACPSGITKEDIDGYLRDGVVGLLVIGMIIGVYFYNKKKEGTEKEKMGVEKKVKTPEIKEQSLSSPEEIDEGIFDQFLSEGKDGS